MKVRTLCDESGFPLQSGTSMKVCCDKQIRRLITSLVKALSDKKESTKLVTIYKSVFINEKKIKLSALIESDEESEKEETSSLD